MEVPFIPQLRLGTDAAAVAVSKLPGGTHTESKQMTPTPRNGQPLKNATIRLTMRDWSQRGLVDMAERMRAPWKFPTSASYRAAFELIGV